MDFNGNSLVDGKVAGGGGSGNSASGGGSGAGAGAGSNTSPSILRTSVAGTPGTAASGPSKALAKFSKYSWKLKLGIVLVAVLLMFLVVQQVNKKKKKALKINVASSSSDPEEPGTPPKFNIMNVFSGKKAPEKK